MSTMIERVAGTLWHSLSTGASYQDAARAAIEAMRELSPEHVVAIYRATTKHAIPSGEEYWKAGIDAALKETA